MNIKISYPKLGVGSFCWSVGLIIAMLLLLPAVARAFSIGARPLVIDLEVPPNKKGAFHIEVYSTSPGEEPPVHLSLFDVVQQESGNLDFVEVGKNPYSCAKWIKLEKTDFTVPAGKIVKVAGEVLVPSMNSGSRLAAIMVETVDDDKKSKGVSIKVRYAVVLKLKIKERTAIERAEVEKIGIKKLSDGAPAIEATILNKSETYFRAGGRATIQDSSRRIITSLDLTTESIEQKKEQKSNRQEIELKEIKDQNIYPGSKVAFFGKIDKPLPAGEYTLLVNMKYGNRSLYAREKVTLTEETAFADRDSARGVSFELKPANLEVKTSAGGVKSAFFNITNITDSPLKVSLSVKDIEYGPNGEVVIKKTGSTPYSASEWIKLEKTEYNIGPRLSQGVLLKLDVPEAAKPGGRYAAIVVEKSGGEKGRAEKNPVEVALIIPGEEKSAVKIKEFKRLEKGKLNKGKGDTGFILDVENDGAKHVMPKGRIVIKDMYNHEVEQAELTLEVKAILPHTTGKMMAMIDRKLIPGEYTAYADIEYSGKETASSKINFVIK